MSECGKSVNKYTLEDTPDTTNVNNRKRQQRTKIKISDFFRHIIKIVAKNHLLLQQRTATPQRPLRT
jgi:hypothetical protein